MATIRSMSKTEIIAELPRLSLHELAEIQGKLDELVGDAWADRGELSDGDKSSLDAEIEAYRADPVAGSPWAAVRARVEARLK